ncbi:NADH-quinone oxidoreductase subunit M [Anaerobacillus alkalidiazotrophicus]|uniref:NADH-quinone oxidoreductase subunit M n=1 Tax=Anaerobacillus alkalidiazotrophicus TaxID=472963 RepID=A0A1S2MDL5_9BACI|nr:NADH-quinone oxidoreductase subunit M [Anaerobacillus alkalidiazotrophicus]OIJ21775.1 NADH-quinone oxidoreductase subunit M [Anaerobacillus alkalidiazotrophicus]
MIPNILSVLVFLPLLGALIILTIPNEHKNVIRSVAGITAFVTLIISVIVWNGFNRSTSGMQFAENYTWIDLGFVSFNYQLGVDGLSMPLLVLTTIVTFLGIIASVSIKERVKEYFVWMLILLTGMLGVFVALDMFLFFLFFELTLIPMFFIIGIWGGSQKEYAAFKFLLYTGLGSAVMLIAFFAMFYQGAVAEEATLNFLRLAEIYANPANAHIISDAFKAGLFITLFVAFAVKLPIFPFHTWLPDAHVQAPTPASMILAGVLLKMGAYGLLRVGFGILPDQAAKFAFLIAILGVVNIIYGALLALVQKDLKKLVAYSSISHMGIVLLGAASFTTQGMQGAIFQLVSHGFIAALLFFMVGAIYERTHTRMIEDLGGLSKTIPILAGFLLAAAMASVGLPGMSGFVSELLAFMGIFGASPEIIPAAKTIAVVAALGIILTAAYLLWAMQRTTFGQLHQSNAHLEDARPIEYIPMICLLGLTILIGVYPAILSDVINITVIDIVSKIGG